MGIKLNLNKAFQQLFLRLTLKETLRIMSHQETQTFKTEHKKYEALTKAASAGFLLVAMTWTIYLLATGRSASEPLQFLIITLLSIATVLILYGVLLKLVRLEFQGKYVNIIHRLTGNIRTFEIYELDGYRTREFRSKGGLVKELILIKDNKNLQTLSSAYITNFERLSKFIDSRLENLGEEEKNIKNRLLRTLIG